MDYQSATRVYQRLRDAIYHVAELEGKKLKGEIEMDEAYFGGRRKGKRGRGADGKSIVFGLLEREGRVYTRVVEHVSKEELMAVIRKKTRKGSVYFTDTFRSYNSLKRLGKHHRVNHSKTLVDKKQKTISTALRDFGVLPSIFCTTIAGFPNITFRCILKKWSIGSITEKRIYSNYF